MFSLNKLLCKPITFPILKIAKPFIEKGIHIVCDKPLTATISDAEKLKHLVYKNKTIFALTHNYSAYPMLREAKYIVSSGKIGKITLVNVEYPQGYTVAIKKKDERNMFQEKLLFGLELSYIMIYMI